MDLTANLDSIQKRMAAACDRADREANSVTLLAVTKSHPPEVVQAAAKLGLILLARTRCRRRRRKCPCAPAICAGT